MSLLEHLQAQGWSDAADILAEIRRHDAVAQPGELLIELPWPPTVNSHWGHRVIQPKPTPKDRNPKPIVSAFVTKRGMAYKADVAKICMDFRIRSWARKYAGSPLRMSIACYPPDGRARDLDNLCKSTQDALQGAGVFENDTLIWHLSLERVCFSAPPGRIIVRLSQYLLEGQAPRVEPSAALERAPAEPLLGAGQLLELPLDPPARKPLPGEDFDPPPAQPGSAPLVPDAIVQRMAEAELQRPQFEGDYERPLHKRIEVPE